MNNISEIAAVYKTDDVSFMTSSAGELCCIEVDNVPDTDIGELRTRFQL